MKKFKLFQYYIYGTTQLLSWNEKIQLMLFECVAVLDNEVHLKKIYPGNIDELPEDHAGCFYKKDDGTLAPIMVVTDDRYGYFVLYDEKKKEQLDKHYKKQLHVTEQINGLKNFFGNV